ncbi:hypothetical protein CGLO_07795 [Colletotrichum gloeosporioides Cg-14]|uniref:Uncharacterized protein n=1 Tax=Colletotrichum gloeosporioides (strain Cg-14) TaxID=1237896 RepID=T0KB47_COLGC|nr:hypothetical protein CGLO_07795 [Colletotrichum gloeosporioides Cg-14]
MLAYTYRLAPVI